MFVLHISGLLISSRQNVWLLISSLQISGLLIYTLQISWLLLSSLQISELMISSLRILELMISSLQILELVFSSLQISVLQTSGLQISGLRQLTKISSSAQHNLIIVIRFGGRFWLWCQGTKMLRILFINSMHITNSNTCIMYPHPFFFPRLARCLLLITGNVELRQLFSRALL